MPMSVIYSCSECGYRLAPWRGSMMYAVDANGRRIPCSYPDSEGTVDEIAGMGWGEARACGRAGFESSCLCLTCLEQFRLDLERDARRCPRCGQAVVKTVNELAGDSCPKCVLGTIQRSIELPTRRRPAGVS